MTRSVSAVLARTLLSAIPALLACVVLLTTGVARAQVATGTPPFASFGGGPFDTINLGNLNVHFAIPIVHKAGRGMPLTYDFTYDSSIWYPSGGAWTPVSTTTWGWRGITEAATGYVTYGETGPSNCGGGTQGYFFRGWAYHDRMGTTHAFPTITVDTCPDGNDQMEGIASDGSGYTMNASVVGTATVYPIGGGSILPPSQNPTGSGTVKDRNGNTLSAAYASNVTTFTDTLGTATLKVTGATVPTKFSYLNPSGAYTDVNVTYTTKNVKTNFGCSGVSEVTINSVSLVTGIGPFPDGSSYTFTYELTPNNSSYTTGRIQQVTLPTGGTILYQYGTTNDGVNCSDGSTANLTRTLAPGGAWTYTHSLVSGTQWKTQVTTPPDPANSGAGDATVLQFQASGSSFYETERQVYQGAATGSPIATAFRCYNNQSVGTPGNCPTTTVTPPISQLDAFQQLQVGNFSRSETLYDPTYGLLTQDKEFDYGGTTPLKNTVITYASVGNNIVDRPACVQTTGGTTATCGTITSDTVSATTFSGYDANGNVGTVKIWVSGVSTPKWLSRGFSNYANGLPQTVTDVNGAQTTITYGDCNAAFPTSISLPLSLSLSMHWDCNGGVPLWTQDENQQQTNYTYDTRWRVTEVGNPDGGSKSITYTTGNTFPWTVATTTAVDSSQNEVHTNFLDGLGRTYATYDTDANSPNGNRRVWTTYNLLGQVSSVTNPYFTASDGSTSYTYDALGRTTQITNQDSSFKSFTYTGAATETVDEASITKVYQTDGLGRLRSVCEVTSVSQKGGSGTPSACNQTINLTGFLTSYAYDALSNLLSVTQPGVNSRSYLYDGLSRLTQEINPESGTTSAPTTYTYDASGQQGDLYQRTRLGPNQAANGTTMVTTTYTFDALHRLTYKSYNDTGAPIPTPAAGFGYDESSVWGTPVSNTKGRLSHTSNTTGASVFSYDQMGRMTFGFQCAPFDCGTAAVEYWYTYNYAGVLTSEKMGDNVTENGYITYTHTIDANGRLTQEASSDTGTNHPSPLYTVNSYNAWGEVVTDTLGNGIQRAFTYDNRGRFLKHVDTLSGSTVFESDAWYSTNNDVAGTSTTNAGSWEFTYDGFNRLSAACQPSSTCVGTPSTATAAYKYAYDPVGNRWTQTIPSTCSGCTGPQPSYSFDGKNRITTASGISYDAAGNVINDGTNTYTYDAENRVITVNGSAQAYFYDAFGRQIQTIYGGNTYSRIFGLNGRAEVQFVGNTWMLSELYAGSMGDYLGNYSNSTTYFAHSDQVGTRHMYTNPSGSSVETCTSLPFGDAGSCSGSGPASPTGFTGQDADPNTNLTRFLFRNYSMQQGRWMHPDPAGLAAVDPSNPQTWNRYAYVLNNPLSNIDPLGLDCIYVSADSVNIVPGDCTSSSDDGYYVDGTVDPNSFTFNPGTQNLGFSYTAASGIFGAGTIAGVDWSVADDSGNPMPSAGSGPGSDPAKNGGWAWNFTKSFFGGFTVNTGPGSCLGVAVDAMTPAVTAVNSAVKNAQQYGPPLIQSLPGTASSVSQGLYGFAGLIGQMKGPPGDAAMATTTAAAINIAATNASAWGAAALAKVPVVAAVALDGALLNAVIQEGRAALNGECK